MATQNEPRVLFCGYRRISNVQEYFKRSSLLRGGDLYAANHVYCVREELDSAVGPSEILGKCVAQMKSVEYEVRLEVSKLFSWHATEITRLSPAWRVACPMTGAH